MKRESNWVDFVGVLKSLWTRKIRDQVYDEKNNIVTIAVVCCNPEKLRDKICCKGYGTIKSIEICWTSQAQTTSEAQAAAAATGFGSDWVVLCSMLWWVRCPPPCYDAYYDSYGGGSRPCYVKKTPLLAQLCDRSHHIINTFSHRIYHLCRPCMQVVSTARSSIITLNLINWPCL